MNLRTTSMAALLAGAALAVGAPSAHASTMSVSGDTVRVTGDATNESMTLWRTTHEGRSWVVVTAGAVRPQGVGECGKEVPITVLIDPVWNIRETYLGTGCPESSLGAISRYDVDLGAGNDWASVVAPFASGIVRGGPGQDVLVGDEDSLDDTFDGGPGADELFGGAGNDTLLGGPDADVLFGDEDNDHLDGGDGDDWLESRAYDPTLYRQPSPRVTTGADTLIGGPGRDRVSYGDRESAVTLTLDGVANDGAGEGDNVGGDIEQISGSAFADTMVGNDAAQTLNGSSGADVVRGGGGDDVLTGESANDQLFGDAGNDTLEGGTENDQLSGDAGNDTLKGEGHDDVLDGGAGTDKFEGDGVCVLERCNGGADEIRARDGEADTVACGVGPDKAIVDQHDTVATDFQQGCETIDRVNVGGVQTQPEPQPVKDPLTVPAKLSLRTLLARGVTVNYVCDGCRLTGKLALKSRTVASGHAATGKPQIKLKVSKAGRKQLRGLRKATLTLTVKVTPADGDATNVRRTLKFMR